MDEQTRLCKTQSACTRTPGRNPTWQSSMRICRMSPRSWPRTWRTFSTGKARRRHKAELFYCCHLNKDGLLQPSRAIQLNAKLDLFHICCLRGETLDNLQGKSDLLLRDSARYRKTARDVNLQALYRKYGPPVIILFVFLLVIYWRFWWY
jgi:hypothetical protein